MFNNGTEKGLRGSIPKGGQQTPISIAGDKLLWKNAQKKDKKNKTSETINNKKPIFKPFTVAFVWKPWLVDSVYGSTFFVATGFHGFHVIIGTIFLLICLVRLSKSHFTRSHHFGFEATLIVLKTT